MHTPSRMLSWILLSTILATGSAGAADSASAGEKDPLRASLLESKEKGKGVTIYASGTTISMVVTAVDERFAIGRNQQASRIVVRLDRIDGVSAAF